MALVNQDIPALFAILGEWAEAHGVKNLDATPGLYVFKVGEFTISMNCHRVETDMVPPFSYKVEANGWPIGVVGPSGGAMWPGGEDQLLAAFEADIAAAKGGATC